MQVFEVPEDTKCLSGGQAKGASGSLPDNR